VTNGASYQETSDREPHGRAFLERSLALRRDINSRAVADEEREEARRAPEEHPDPQAEGEQHPVLKMILVGVVAAVIGTVITLIMDWFPEPAAGAANEIDTLYDVLLICSVPIFVLVMTVAIYSVVKFRARPGDTRDGAPIHGHTRLEIVWVTIPFIMVTALAVYGWVVLDDLEAKGKDELQVKVTGQQFTWSFEYPEEKAKSQELVLPVNRRVHFRINTNDVVHSFWVPEFRLKSDAVPGLTTEYRVTPDRPGRYQVVCAELCGIGHATMRQKVRVVPQDEFDAWVEKKAGGGGQAADGKQLFTSEGCGGCHAFKPAGTSATTGPPLDDLAKEAAKRKPGLSAEEYVKESIEDPRAFTVKGFGKNVMPTTFKDLGAEKIDALVGYLLKPGS